MMSSYELYNPPLYFYRVSILSNRFGISSQIYIHTNSQKFLWVVFFLLLKLFTSFFFRGGLWYNYCIVFLWGQLFQLTFFFSLWLKTCYLYNGLHHVTIASVYLLWFNYTYKWVYMESIERGEMTEEYSGNRKKPILWFQSLTNSINNLMYGAISYT